MLKKKHYLIIILIAIVAISGCATKAAYFKLAPSLESDMRTFDGAKYVSLAKLCDFYGLECKWDSFTGTATINKRFNRIALRSGSKVILVNGEERRLDAPVVLVSGAVFVPVSFVNRNLGPIIGAAPAEAPPEVTSAPKRFTIKTVVIDPGHGGKDVGAVGRRIRLREKERALYLARRIKSLLEANGIRVIMTRNDDTFIPLGRRATIANQKGADLFVSVHINASRSRFMRGFECYYLSNATDDNARALEASENASLKMGDDADAEHSENLDKTLWDMALTENRLESAELAEYICDSIESSAATSNRGVRSARFYVLKHTNMPAVLVETGYISNRYEELKIKDDNFLDRIADAVVRGIMKYKREYERTEAFTKT